MEITVQGTTLLKGVHQVVLKNQEKLREELALAVATVNRQQLACPAHHRAPFGRLPGASRARTRSHPRGRARASAGEAEKHRRALKRRAPAAVPFFSSSARRHAALLVSENSPPSSRPYPIPLSTSLISSLRVV